VKNTFCKLFQVYSWLIVIPVSWLITALFAFLTITFSLLVNPKWTNKWIAPWWGKLIILITFCRVKIIDRQNAQVGQSYIIVCNHQSLYDILTIYGYLPVEIKWVMKKELGKMPFVGIACKTLGHIFVDRRNSEKAKQSLIDAKDDVSGGVSAFFFPEGSRSTNGELTHFKKGAFRMAKTLELPILPVTISGANKVMPAKSLKICPHEIKLIIHQPISADVVATETINSLSVQIKSIIASAL
jgi:1-acyl-sn-glycerol-3-phosphate acyltransferase